MPSNENFTNAIRLELQVLKREGECQRSGFSSRNTICSSSLTVSPNKLFKVLFLLPLGSLKVQQGGEVAGDRERGATASHPGKGGEAGIFAPCTPLPSSRRAVRVHGRMSG